MEFIGLAVINEIPDATTVGFFRERHRKKNVIDEPFKMFESYLRDQGKSPSRWMDESPNRLHQVDWMRVVRKHDMNHYGYKNSICGDAEYGVFRSF